MSAAGRLAYEEDCRRHPRYHDGSPRRAWDDLSEHARWSWERNPTPREPVQKMHGLTPITQSATQERNGGP